MSSDSSDCYFTKIGEKAPRRGALMGGWAIARTVEDLISKCLFALDDPKADRADLQQILAECSARLTELVAERRQLRQAMRAQLDEIATLVASQEAVWPEEVARLEALRKDIRKRAALFAEG
jgi:vacuolar-type H+-ATPase subunit I/STV1